MTLSSSGCSLANIRNILRTNGVPIILIDDFSYLNISGVNNHAVVVYGYDSNNYIKVHTGRTENTNVTLTYYGLTAFDGGLYVTNPSAGSVTLSDAAPSSDNSWKRTAAIYNLRYNFMDYYSGTYFRYDYNATRDVIINALYEIASSPKVTSAQYTSLTNKFSDISSSSEYYDAAAWAYAKGIIVGVDDTHLGLNETLTREQAATFFYRFANQSGVAFSFRSTSGPAGSSFSDWSDVSTYAQTAVNWATRRCLLAGNDQYLYPQSALTRAELAQMVYNFSNSAYRT